MEKETKGARARAEQVKFLRLYNTRPFITVSTTAGYIAASTKAFSFDGDPAEISSNVNMYAPFSIYSFLKVLYHAVKRLHRPFNVGFKYFYRLIIITADSASPDDRWKPRGINEESIG